MRLWGRVRPVAALFGGVWQFCGCSKNPVKSPSAASNERKEQRIMNKCIFTGRFATDPEIRTTQNGTAQCSFRLAVQRRFKDSNGERQADFIQCIAWRQTAEFIHKFFHKGDEAKVVGALQNRSYQAQDGTTRYVSEIMVEEFEGSSKEGAQGKQNTPEGQGFMPIVDDSELPF